MASGFEACLRPNERLECAERIDPAGHAMHVAAAAAWGFAQSVSNAAEGITWGVLLFVSVIRLPKVWRCFAPVVRDPLWMALLGGSLWACASMAWSVSPPPGIKPWIPDRWVLTPLLLWPAMGRPWVVLGAIGAGALVQVGSALWMSWNGVGLASHMKMASISGFGQLQWQLHCAAVIAASGLRCLPVAGRPVAALGFAASMLAVAHAGRRLTFLSSLTGSLIAWTRPRASRRAAILVLSGAALLVALAFTTPIGSRVMAVGRVAARSADGELRYVALSQVSGNRLPLAHAALAIGLRSPIAGNGKGSFQAMLPGWAEAQQAEHPERAKALAALRKGVLNDAHNALLSAFSEGGAIGTVLLGTALLGLGVRLWRQSAASLAAGAALAVYSSILLGMLCYPITAKAPGAIIATCLAVSWSIAPRRPRPGASGTA